MEPDGEGGVLFTDYSGGRLMHQAPGEAATEMAMLEIGAADLEFMADTGLIVVPLSPANTIFGLSSP